MPVMTGIIPNEVLSNNSKIPILGLSTVGLSDVLGSTAQSVKDAIDLGYRYIDTSPNTSESEVGEAVNAKIKEGVVKREELYIVGKLWDTKAFHNPALIKDALLKTLKNLNLAYIDLYIINCPEGIVFANEDFVDTWYAMENLVDLFLVKSIGLSHFNIDQIQHLLNGARVLPVVNQIECHPYFTQRALTEFCRERRIIVAAFNIYGSSPDLIQDPIILDMAKKYKRSPEQILIRYQLEKGHVAVAQIQKESQLVRNLEVFKFEIDKSDIAAMDKLDRNKKYI